VKSDLPDRLRYSNNAFGIKSIVPILAGFEATSICRPVSDERTAARRRNRK
jgi:hypothetical protein